MRPISQKFSGQRNRRIKGSTLAEAAISSFLTIVVGALALDVSIFALAFMNLDKTARDCARAAAQATPTTGQTYSQAATQAALGELKNHATDGFFCQQPQLVNNTLTTYQDWSGAGYGGTPPNIPNSTPTTGQTPYLTATCSEVVRLPIQISFFGANISDSVGGGSGTITLKRQYTFPIVKYNFSMSNANANL